MKKDSAGDPQQEPKQSIFSLLWCKMTFTNEPAWLRLAIVIIAAATTIVVVYLMKR